METLKDKYERDVERWRDGVRAIGQTLGRGWQSELASRIGCANSTISGAMKPGGYVSHKMKNLITSAIGGMINRPALTQEDVVTAVKMVEDSQSTLDSKTLITHINQVIGSQSAQHLPVPALSKRQQAVLEVVMRECPNAELVHHFIGGEVFIADANDRDYEEPEGDDVNLYIVEIKGKRMVGEIKPLDDGWIVEEATTGKLYSAPSEWGDWVLGVVFFTGQMVDREEGGEDEEGVSSQ